MVTRMDTTHAAVMYQPNATSVPVRPCSHTATNPAVEPMSDVPMLKFSAAALERTSGGKLSTYAVFSGADTRLFSTVNTTTAAVASTIDLLPIARNVGTVSSTNR